MNEYAYAELREKALSAESTAEDRIELFDWMENYDMRAWNGEYFDIDEGLRLYPVYDITEDEDGEILEMTLIDAEIR